MSKLWNTLLPTLLLLLGVGLGASLAVIAAQQGKLANIGIGEACVEDGAADLGADIDADSPVSSGSLGRTVRWIQDAASQLRGASRTIYLNREGVVLTGSFDDAAQNHASVAMSSGYSRVVIPGYSGTDRGWRALVRCVKQRFAPFDVRVTDQRPVDTQDYVMAAFGGSARAFGYTRKAAKSVGGLAPFSGKPIARAVVFVFTATLKNRSEDSCDTAAMEIAHAYGLDHAFDCRDVMTYKKRCSTRRFVNKAVRCGEDKPRDCTGGAKTQNSYAALMTLLGARKAPAPVLTSVKDPNAKPKTGPASAGPTHDHGTGQPHQH